MVTCDTPRTPRVGVAYEYFGGGVDGGVMGRLDRYADSTLALTISLRKPRAAPFRQPQVGVDSIALAGDGNTLSLPIVNVREYRLGDTAYADVGAAIDSQSAALLRTSKTLTASYDIYVLRVLDDELSRTVRPFLGIRRPWVAAGLRRGPRFEQMQFDRNSTSFTLAVTRSGIASLSQRPDGRLHIELDEVTAFEPSGGCAPDELVMVTDHERIIRNAVWHWFEETQRLAAQVPVDSAFGVALFTAGRIGLSVGCYQFEVDSLIGFRELARFSDGPRQE